MFPSFEQIQSQIGPRRFIWAHSTNSKQIQFKQIQLANSKQIQFKQIHMGSLHSLGPLPQMSPETRNATCPHSPLCPTTLICHPAWAAGQDGTRGGRARGQGGLGGGRTQEGGQSGARRGGGRGQEVWRGRRVEISCTNAIMEKPCC
jgi:hypothetical protein